MSRSFEDFRKDVLVSVEEMCRTFYSGNREAFKVKKESLVVKNLEAIMNSALKLSNETGFQSMSLRELSRESGLSMGALYTYFSSKEELLKMIHSQARQVAMEILVRETAAEAGVHERLKRAILTHLYLSEIMKHWFCFFFMETKNLKPEDRKIPRESELDTEQIFIDILDEGVGLGIYAIEDTILAGAMIKALLQDWYLKQWKYQRRRVGIEQYYRFTVSVVEAYVLPVG